jgi:hypothetical protein
MYVHGRPADPARSTNAEPRATLFSIALLSLYEKKKVAGLHSIGIRDRDLLALIKVTVNQQTRAYARSYRRLILKRRKSWGWKWIICPLGDGEVGDEVACGFLAHSVDIASGKTWRKKRVIGQNLDVDSGTGRTEDDRELHCT